LRFIYCRSKMYCC